MFYNMQKGKIKGVFSVPKQYIAIDLKSFYASVECVERGLDPMTTHLVVADASRTEKTICLAVSPALKAHGISGRARLFEVVQRVTEVNALRKAQNKVRDFTGEALDSRELAEHPCGEAKNGPLYGMQRPDLQRVSALCGPGGYPPLFHR